MNIALIAHDKKKDNIIEMAVKFKHVLEKHDLISTGTTGKKIMEITGLEISRMNSGPLGGDQQIGGLVSEGKIDFVIFFRDPLTAQPHEPDVNALLRLCDVYSVPVATNRTIARVLLEFLEDNEDFEHYKTKEV